jgi:hypothetical protein
MVVHVGKEEVESTVQVVRCCSAFLRATLAAQSLTV